MNTDKIVAESIAKDYAPKTTSKLVALKKLDARAKRPARIFAYIFGTVCTLVFGTGMCLSMHVIGPATVTMMVIGIIIGLLGIAGVSVNPMLYNRIAAQGKQKYASDIMELAKQISEEEEE